MAVRITPPSYSSSPEPKAFPLTGFIFPLLTEIALWAFLAKDYLPKGSLHPWPRLLRNQHLPQILVPCPPLSSPSPGACDPCFPGCSKQVLGNNISWSFMSL